MAAGETSVGRELLCSCGVIPMHYNTIRYPQLVVFLFLKHAWKAGQFGLPQANNKNSDSKCRTSHYFKSVLFYVHKEVILFGFFLFPNIILILFLML